MHDYILHTFAINKNADKLWVQCMVSDRYVINER